MDAGRHQAAVRTRPSDRASIQQAVKPDRDPRWRPGVSSLDTDPATILQLQRTAGNEAVNLWLQRAPAPPAAAAPAAPAAPATLTAAQLATAKAQTKGVGPEAMNQLQEKLGVTQSSWFDDDTAQAVYAQQRAWQPTGAIAHPGVADSTFFARLGIIRTKDFESAPLARPLEARALAQRLAAQFPNGISIAAYSRYDIRTGNAREFESQASWFAEGQQSVGLADGKLKVGVSVPITSTADLVEKVQGIHLALVDAWLASKEPATFTPQQAAIIAGATGAARRAVAMITGLPTDEPAWTKVATIATFAHGIHEGLNLGNVEEHDYATKGLHVDGSNIGKDYASNVESFAKGLQGAVSPDVKVLVFACSTASTPQLGAAPAFDKEQKALGFEQREKNAGRAAKKARAKALSQGKSAADADKAAEAAAAAARAGFDADAAANLAAQEATGGGSLAEGLQAALKKKLGGKPSVYGHLTAAHVTRNPFAKVYGADAANQPGGMHIFRRIYDAPYIDGQMKSQFPAATSPKEIGDLRPKLVTRMYEHFYDQIQQDKDPVTGSGGKPIAQEMFADFKAAQSILQAEMSTWLAANTADLRPLELLPEEPMSGPPLKPWQHPYPR